MASKPVTLNPLCSHLALGIEFPCKGKKTFDTMQITKKLAMETFANLMFYFIGKRCSVAFILAVFVKHSPKKEKLQGNT